MENQTAPTINLELTVEEFNFLHALLGDLPTKTNAWVLRNNIERQAQVQAHARWVVLPQSGHAPMWDQVDAVVNETISLVQSVNR